MLAAVARSAGAPPPQHVFSSLTLITNGFLSRWWDKAHSQQQVRGSPLAAPLPRQQTAAMANGAAAQMQMASKAQSLGLRRPSLLVTWPCTFSANAGPATLAPTPLLLLWHEILTCHCWDVSTKFVTPSPVPLSQCFQQLTKHGSSV